MARPPELVLASTSPYRRALLERLGVSFQCLPPLIDERAHEKSLGPMAPRELAARLASAKAMSLAAPGRAVLGGDQLVAFEGRVLGKPGTADRAVEQLLELAGHTHELITAVAVIHEDRLIEHVDIARLTMRRLTRDEASRYVEADRPLDCAGSYKIEARGIALFEAIDAADHTAITGLPLMAVSAILRDLGYSVP
jgi:septum formation protein